MVPPPPLPPPPPPPPQRNAVPAGNDHPLAARTDAPPGASMGSVKPDAPGSFAAPQAAPRSPVPSATSPRAIVTPASVSPARTQTLDGQADAFLSIPSYRTNHLGLEPIMRPLPLPPGEGIDRIRTLVERRAWGDVLKLSANVLHSGNPHADIYLSLQLLPPSAPRSDVDAVPVPMKLETVEVMALHCHALLKLRRYADLEKEVGKWNFLSQNEANAVCPDWMPWSMHILGAQALQYVGDSNAAADILHNVQSQIPPEDASSLASVNIALANLYIRKEQWRLAFGSLDRVMELIPAATEMEIQSKYSTAPNREGLKATLVAAYQSEVRFRQGKALLQLGALPQAAELFEHARKEWTAGFANVPQELTSHTAVILMSCQMDVNEALFYFAQNDYDHAKNSFSIALETLRRQDLLNQRYNTDAFIGTGVVCMDAPNELYSECVNNMALCNLYSCRMQDAVSQLEDLVRSDPTSFLTERVAFNLCTLYELGADSAVSARRKRVLQLIAKRFFLHDIGPESFRVS